MSFKFTKLYAKNLARPEELEEFSKEWILMRKMILQRHFKDR